MVEMLYVECNIIYSRVNFPIKNVHILLSKTRTLRDLRLFLKLKQRKLQSEQYIFVA
jgi:hypothetical protein